jgi:predicted RND superfamily exporter protein
VFALSSGNSEVSSYVHEGLDAFRLVVLFPYLPNSKLDQLIGQISAILSRHFGSLPGVSARPSGVAVLWANMDDAVARGQVTSILSMAAAMFLSFLISLRSWTLAVTSTFVNVLPIVSIGALLGATGRPIDMATVFIMGVALGIADDDTSFTVHECVDRSEQGRLGVAATIRHTGPATIASCTVIVLGFGVLMVSSFTPIRTFGGMTAVGLLLAMLCDVIVLPFLLLAHEATIKDSTDAKTVISRPGVVRTGGGAESR